MQHPPFISERKNCAVVLLKDAAANYNVQVTKISLQCTDDVIDFLLRWQSDSPEMQA